MIVIGAAFGFALALLGALGLLEIGARRVYDYALTPTAFVVRLFGRFPVYRVAFTDIVDADFWRLSVPRAGALFTTLRLGNRIFGRAVVIKRRGGFPRYVVVTPDDPKGMIAKLHTTIGRDPEGNG